MLPPSPLASFGKGWNHEPPPCATLRGALPIFPIPLFGSGERGIKSSRLRGVHASQASRRRYLFLAARFQILSSRADTIREGSAVRPPRQLGSWNPRPSAVVFCLSPDNSHTFIHHIRH